MWASAGEHAEAEVIAAIDALVAERPTDDPAALFEAAGARDFAGLEADAEPLYRRAIALGLTEPQLGQATIQLASTLRNLGRYDESIALLDGFEDAHPLADAAAAFRALTLVSAGNPAAGAAVALDALAKHLPRYAGSVRAYAAQLR